MLLQLIILPLQVHLVCELLAYFLNFLNLFLFFCSVRVIDIDGRWVTLGELANCVKGVGQLSTSIAELHVRVLQYKETPNRLIFPWVLSVYLLIGDFKSKCLLKYFRRDKSYILSHQDQVCYVCWIWYVMFACPGNSAVRVLVTSC